MSRAKREVDSKDRLLAIRIPASLLSQIDTYVDRMRTNVPWASTTRSDAVRWLLTNALRHHDLAPRDTDGEVSPDGTVGPDGMRH